MTALLDELGKVKSRIEKYGSKCINEQDTKATLIQPIMRILGWDVEDLEDVQREYKQRKQDKPVDYALFLLRTPSLFIEAKALGENLDDRKWANQIMGYAGVAGVGWVVLTDGNEYRLYNTHAAVPIEEKLFRTLRIVDDIEGAATTLKLLSKQRMIGNEIDALWKAFFVDRQVKASIADALSGADTSFVRLLAKRLPGLAPKDIRSSLQRAEVKIDFPLEPDDSALRTQEIEVNDVHAKRSLSANTKLEKIKERPRDSGKLLDMGVPKSEQLSVLIRSGFIRAGQIVQARYRATDLKATITEDGKVKFAGVVYQTLSAAGAAAKNYVSGKGYLATDGWTFWEMNDGNGNKIPMKVPRRAYLAKKRK